MKNLLNIGLEERNRILEMHKVSAKKLYLKEDTTPNYSKEEANDLEEKLKEFVLEELFIGFLNNATIYFNLEANVNRKELRS
jgi:hypothetical protein